MLFSLPREVVPGVWSAIGATALASYNNARHNKLSFIITNTGLVVVSAGGNCLLARSLHEEIMKITDQSVCYVVLENGLQLLAGTGGQRLSPATWGSMSAFYQ